ncbi:MAG TPA: hypothetical protein VIL37_20325 [Natronosporangium sp.]
MTAVAAACLVLAAVVMVWPGPGRRSRYRRILAPTVARRWRPLPGSLRRLPVAGRLPAGLLVAAVVMIAVAAGGPVAGIVAGCYGALAARLLRRRDAQRARAARRTELLDLLGSAAADLRAGLPTELALASFDPVGDDPLLPRIRAAVVLADRTGAPLADVLERIEADARGVDRARQAAAAQAAGARATGWLLAGLPAAGIGLGYAIGADPLAVLLHTPAGAGCALGALALQLAGLSWAGRITRSVQAVAS